MLTPRRPPEDDKFHEECALFGIYGTNDAAAHTALGLHALQHRGQEASGIVTFDGGHFYNHRAAGLVGDIFGDPRVIATLQGYSAIGHNRYATTGGSSDRNIQPIFADFDFGGLALAHNGNLTNAYLLRKELVRMGCLFQSTTDTEVINHLIARSNYSTVVDRVIDALGRVKGAYSLLMLTNEALLGVRDPMGVRPLCIGRLDDAWILTSESCALDILGARFVRDVEPGEMVIVGPEGMTRERYAPVRDHAHCVFEHVYFSRPDSIVFGRPVQHSREMLGRLLAIESPVDADVVVPVPDSGVAAAIGYAAEAGIPFRQALIRNHYVGRTFIEPSQAIRDFGVKLKLNPVRHLLEGKRVILVDDSLVRGTTSRKIVRMVRGAGAREVHLRISCPPTVSPCFYGVDTPNLAELIAANNSVEEIRRFVEADSLSYLSLRALREAVADTKQDFCYACYTGDYPTELVNIEQLVSSRRKG